MLQTSFFSCYRDKRILSVFVLGVASGFPWVLIGSALTLWLKDSGLSRSDIGYSGLIFAVYAINFFWSPIVDRVNMPLLSNYLGKRKAWIIPCQLAMAILCVGLSYTSPEHSAKLVIFLALLIAVSSSTQDIAIDAYRIDSFSSEESSALATAAGAATAGWWTGYAGLGFIPLFLSDLDWQWPQLYLLMTVFLGTLILLTIALPKPKYSYSGQRDQDADIYLSAAQSMPFFVKLRLMSLVLSPIALAFWGFLGSFGAPAVIVNSTAYVPALIICGLLLATIAAINLTLSMRYTNVINTRPSTFDSILARLLASLCSPIKDFFQRNGLALALYILLFIFLFKIGEAFLGRMSIVFYKEIGFSNTDIATYSKMLTWWVTIFSALVAGAINAKLGLLKGLFISGVFMAVSNLMFSLIAYVGPSIPLYIATIIIDGIATSWSLVAFVAFISALCNHRFSASQYALLASLGALGRTTLSSMSGQIVDWLNGNWALFFMLTALMVLPSLILLMKLAKTTKLNERL